MIKLITKDGYNLEIGTKIYYTGDQANIPGNFIIVEIFSDRWGTHIVLDEIDGEDRKHIVLQIVSFEPGIGRRFIPKELRDKEISEYMNRIEAYINK